MPGYGNDGRGPLAVDGGGVDAEHRRPESVLVVIHTPKLECLLLERVLPAGFWQSVTGSLHWGESAAAAAAREVAEETGLDPANLCDAKLSRRFEILPEWQRKYAPGVHENVEHCFYLEVAEPLPVTLNPAEHSAYAWLPLEEAIARAGSWTNREALEGLRDPAVLQIRDPAAKQDEQQAGTDPSSAEAVVVVHGLWMPGWETMLLRRRLQAAGFGTHQFVYPTIGLGLNENAERLAEFAEKLPGRRVHFVGHSLGGVLILKLFELHGFPRAGRIVCLGSPLTGTHSGRMLESYALGRRMVGRCIRDLLESGGFRQWQGPQDLGVIAGDVPLGFGRVLGGLEKPNDGTVAVNETRLPGAADHEVLHCTHMSMLWSPEVAEHVRRFLREGRFRPAAAP